MIMFMRFKIAVKEERSFSLSSSGNIIIRDCSTTLKAFIRGNEPSSHQLVTHIFPLARLHTVSQRDVMRRVLGRVAKYF